MPPMIGLYATACFLAAASALYLYQGITVEAAAMLLSLAAADIFRHRFCDQPLTVTAEALLIFAAALYQPAFWLLLPVALAAASAHGLAWPALAAGGLALLFVNAPWQPFLGLLVISAVVIGSLWRERLRMARSYEALYDEERRTRYELEGTKNRLMQSIQEQVKLAEAQERGRIARDIHDHVGHGLAGVLLQLQAADKLMDRDEAKAKDMLRNSVERLSQSVSLMRETVHNLRPKTKLGIEYLREIVDTFQFCPTELRTHGDVGRIPGHILEMAGAVIKEALTNASKYSRADTVLVQIDVYDSFVRVMVEDDGVGVSGPVQEGMGLSGIRERVQNMGGSVSLRSQPGFMILCILPLSNESGVLT